jgi:hypothetical protein
MNDLISTGSSFVNDASAALVDLITMLGML